MEQLNNLWFKYFSNRLLSVMSIKNPWIQKHVKREAKATMCKKLLFLALFLFFWHGICLKLKTLHKFTKSKKKELIQCIYVTMGGSHIYHSCLDNSRAIYIRAIILHCNMQATNSYDLACKGMYITTTNL